MICLLPKGRKRNYENNLAKVLGLEEYNQEPNIRVEPTEDEVIQIQQDNFVKEMADHSEATTEALEAIGNAQALASVIARNNSQDKTAYELLKVAVEQLKEKTGVKTQSVSLESLDKGSYKTEALEDVKKFIEKIWEAIKKAFFAMVEKVKSFFKMLFDKEKNVEKEVEEVKKEFKEFEKEEEELPKNESEAKTYKGAYSTSSKPLALGYTPGITNKVNGEDKKINTGEKQPEYSNKTYDKPGEFPTGVENFKFSKIVYRFLSAESIYDSTVNNIKDQIKELLSQNMLDVSDMLKLLEKTKDDTFTLPHVRLGRILTNVGKQDIIVKLEDRKAVVEFSEVKRTDKVPILRPAFIYENLLSPTNDCFNILNGYEKKYLSDQNKVMQEVEKLKRFLEANKNNGKETYDRVHSNINKLMSFIASFAVVFSEIKKYVIGLTKAIIVFLRETMTVHKIYYTDVMNTKGYLFQVDKLKKLGWIEA